MNTLDNIQVTQAEQLKGNAAIMRQCALIDAILAEDSELIELMTEQRIDDTGKARAEYLGGNGQATWSHCKGHIIENAGNAGGSIDEQTELERQILELAVTEHQSSIETNGNYNIKHLSRWTKGAYNAEKAADAVEARHLKALGMQRTKDAARDTAKAATYDARKAKRLAKLAARKGIK